jgi:hypothetical protein
MGKAQAAGLLDGRSGHGGETIVYDGHEAVTGSVACPAPLQSLICGGEQYNSGDFITSLMAANALWLIVY